MQAVGRSFEAPPLPCLEGILSHQPGAPMTTDGDPVMAKLARHAWAAVGCVRQCKGRANMGQQHHVLILSTAGRSILSRQNSRSGWTPRTLQRRWTGNSFFAASMRTEPHRLPSLAKKVAALFQDLAFLPQDLILAPQPLQLSRCRSSCRSGGGLDLVLTALVEPAPQRRKADAEVPGDLPLRPTTHFNQPNGSRPQIPSQTVAAASPMKCSSFPSEELPPLSQGKSNPDPQHETSFECAKENGRRTCCQPRPLAHDASL